MNGAHAVLETLTACGVEVCFANPGTSEIHLVEALDDTPSMRAVLCLFEGVATGAADGYWRMAGRPATTILHLGPGFANGLSNLHDARRSNSPVVNLVGDQASFHKRYDAPLDSDLEALARVESGWVRCCSRAADAGPDAAEAVAAALGPPGRVATLLLPADASWGDGGRPAQPRPLRPAPPAPEDAVAAAAKALTAGEPAVLLIGGASLREPGLRAAAAIARASGATVLTETHMAHVDRGAGRPSFRRLAYFPEMATAQLAGAHHLVLAGARSPVSFFAYPGQPSDLVPPDCELHVLATASEDVVGALEALASRLAPSRSDTASAAEPGAASGRQGSGPLPTGPLTAEGVGLAVGATLPEGAVLVDEAITAAVDLAQGTEAAAPHDLLCHVGGAIGQGMPLATGAALACPDRRVVCVEADGSSLYTPQALWTQAREGLDVTTVILNNRSYGILQIEMHRMRPEPPGSAAARLLDLGSPGVDFVSLAKGFGVPAARVDTAEGLAGALNRALAEPGPALIEAVLEARS